MENLSTDSPLCRRIVIAFLDFLKSVEPAPGVDLEGLEVAKECLEEVFKLSPSSTDDQVQTGLLINFFRSLEDSKRHETKSDLGHAAFSANNASTSSVPNIPDANVGGTSKPPLEDQIGEPHTLGFSKDELFGQFFAALEKINFFRSKTDGADEQAQLDKATKFFHDALAEIESSGQQTINRDILAETLKSQGNKIMQSKLYSDAIELYTCAIALCSKNAVYYCNRAAAYTQIQKYTEAIGDCLKSIEIDSNYSKAYSRLGLAYYAQGNYKDAINKGFLRALELDPTSDSIKENIRVAEEKLKEETSQRTRRDQSTGSTSHNNQQPNNQFTGGSRNQGAPPPFSSLPLTPDLAQMFMNMAATASGHQTQEAHHDGSDTDSGYDEPEIRIGGNINFNFGEVPGDISGALRSMMEMFSGVQPPPTPPPPPPPPQHPQENPQGDMNRGPAPS